MEISVAQWVYVACERTFYLLFWSMSRYQYILRLSECKAGKAESGYSSSSRLFWAQFPASYETARNEISVISVSAGGSWNEVIFLPP